MSNPSPLSSLIARDMTTWLKKFAKPEHESSSSLMAMLQAGFELTHVYGLTETYGPVTVNEWHPEWDAADSPASRAFFSLIGAALHHGRPPVSSPSGF